MNRAENIKRMYEQAKLDTIVEKDKTVLEKMKEVYLQESKFEPKTAELSLWRTIKKSKITKFAAAAVIIIAAVLLLTVWDASAYALEQTIQAYKGLCYVHIKDFRDGESEPREFWVELDEKEQVKKLRAYLPAWAEREGPMVCVWGEGKIQIRSKKYNVIETERRDSLGSEILKIIKEFDPRSVVKELRQLEAEGKVKVTTSEPPSKSEPIVITAEFHLQNDKAGKVVVFVDQSTKLVTRIILPISDSGDGYQHSLEFSDYNVALDEGVFMLEATPEITKKFMKDINAKLALLDINKSKVTDVVNVLGEPWAYRFRGENYFKKDNLPDAYTMSYPGGFIVNIYKNQVVQWGCQQNSGDEISGYVIADSIQIGTPIDDVFKKLGSPKKVVEGFDSGNNKIMYEDNTGYANMNINERKGFCFSRYDDNEKEIKIYFDDNVLYKDLGGIKGICLYGTVSDGKRIRFSFMDDKVIGMYEYRTEPIGTTK